MKPHPTVVILAAGQGSRFKSASHKLQQQLDAPAAAAASKLLPPGGGALTVLGSTVRHAIASHLPVVVVTRAALAEEATRWVAARDVVLLPESVATRGMGRSIAAGVAARSTADGWLLLPADMPLVQPATLRAVAKALGEHSVAYAQHKGRRGHPVGFSAEHYSELMLLDGDEGARRIVARYPSFGVEVPDPGVLVDVDTTDDLAALLKNLHDGPASPAPVR